MASYSQLRSLSLWGSLCAITALTIVVGELQSMTHSSSKTKLENITQTAVYTAGEGGYYCFRIPALLFTNKGTLLAFAEGRGRTTNVCSDHGDVHIVLKRSSDMGQTWSNLSIVHEETGHTIGNTAPVLDQSSGVITLVFCRDNLEVFTLQSSDEGLSWGALQNITAVAREQQWGFTGSGPPGGIQLPSGRLLVGMYASGPGSYTIYSDNGGESWNRSKSIGSALTGECQVAAMDVQSDAPLLIMASRSIIGRFLSYSKDGGASWFNTSLDKHLSPQTPCESSIVSMPYKGAYLNTHLYLTSPHSLQRENLTLFTSSDGGQSWGAGEVVWSGPAAYSSLAYQELKLYCLYERGDMGKEYWSTLTLAVVSLLI